MLVLRLRIRMGARLAMERILWLEVTRVIEGAEELSVALAGIVNCHQLRL